ncbi:MAG: hypothetical protein J7K46_10795 [Bacteroidales bacterium]|nr:hypothetical protein [Bacteroidales bacterium]
MKEDNAKFRTFDFFSFLWKYRRPILIVTIVGIVASVVVSLLITPRFAAEVILYPSASSSVSKTLISTQWVGNKDILSFGDEEETERLLQILQSDRIRKKLVHTFNLFEHYDIKPTEKYKYTKLQNKLKKNISFRKTEYMAVRIRVLDTDPVLAADMANTLATLLDSTITVLQKEKAQKAFALVREEYFKLQQEVNVLQDSLVYLSNLGVYDVSSQSRGLNEAFAEAVRNNDQNTLNNIQHKLQILSKYGGSSLTLRDKITYSIEQLSNLRIKYSEARVDAEQDLPHIYIVKKAEIPDKKATPKRSLIVMATTLSVFLFAVILLLIMEAIRSRTE